MTAATLGVRIPTIVRLREAGRDALRAGGGNPSPSLDADLLLGHVVGFARAQLMAHGAALVDRERAHEFAALVARRQTGEPMAYLLGTREFYGMSFHVTPDTLIPRPETETLVEAARTMMAGAPPDRIIDLGTGSGCVAVAMAQAFPAAQVWATDASPDACAAARANAAGLGYGDRLTVLHHYFSDLLPSEIETPVDLVLCNPPYLTEAEWADAPPDVRDFEPRDALVAGGDGLFHYSDVIRTATAVLRRDGWLMLEIGARQARSVRALLSAADWGAVTVPRDLAGRDRVVCARRKL